MALEEGHDDRGADPGVVHGATLGMFHWTKGVRKAHEVWGGGEEVSEKAFMKEMTFTGLAGSLILD